jgi:hypothetical protein
MFRLHMNPGILITSDNDKKSPQKRQIPIIPPQKRASQFKNDISPHFVAFKSSDIPLEQG